MALIALASGCARHEPPTPGTLSAATAPSDAAAIDDASAGPPPSRGGPWAEAIRLEKWDEAWRGLEALDDAEKGKAEVRYARARVALARDDAATALTALSGLEKELPLLGDDVRRYRAEAELVVGPFEDAGDAFLARGTPASVLKAAQAFEKAKLPVRAKAACDRLVTLDHRTRAQEAEARAMRMRLAPPNDAGAASDARWLAMHGADLAPAKDAEGALARLDPKHPLTTDELLTRAQVLADAGKTDEAVRVIDTLGAAPGRRLTTLERLRAKGDALFKGRAHYLEAAHVLHEAAQAGGPHAVEDAFRAARALARADHDDDAIVALARIAQRSATTPWGEEASYLVGKLHLLHGRWHEAAHALDAYARAYRTGANGKDAARDRALSHLLAGDAKTARKLFEELAEDEPDTLAAARARTMAALAALRDNDRIHAIARWTDVARSRPLSWPALVARARLADIGAPLPPMIDAADESRAAAGGAGAGGDPIDVKLPPPVDTLHRIGLDADAEAALREREGVVASVAPGRSVEALCAAYGQLGRAKRRYQIAQQIPTALLNAAPTPRTRWSWECAYPRPYAAVVAEEERNAELPDGLVYGVMRQESGFDPDALSPARAVGLLQLMPETARQVASAAAMPDDDARLTSPPYNVALGARYLHTLLGELHGVTPLAVAAYNAGPDAVSRWLKRPRGLDLDLFVERIPYAETRAYVAKVMGNWARYAYFVKGESAVPALALHDGNTRSD